MEEVPLYDRMEERQDRPGKNIMDPFLIAALSVRRVREMKEGVWSGRFLMKPNVKNLQCTQFRAKKRYSGDRRSFFFFKKLSEEQKGRVRHGDKIQRFNPILLLRENRFATMKNVFLICFLLILCTCFCLCNDEESDEDKDTLYFKIAMSNADLLERKHHSALESFEEKVEEVVENAVEIAVDDVQGVKTSMWDGISFMWNTVHGVMLIVGLALLVLLITVVIAAMCWIFAFIRYIYIQFIDQFYHY
ncbi:unnamed protein product [Orchesella dallaii]|uniref:Transmembrane protein n=1 Tax=Orchesella dallaii TaxID=48710 RepID=A0ABP1RIF0_9HEXA